MAIKQFKVGKSYRWIGPDDYNENFNDDMEAWLDVKAHKCLRHVENSAAFIDISGGNWDYGHCLKHFEEVTDKGKKTPTDQPFTVGDRVRVKEDFREDCCTFKKGETGTIVNITDDLRLGIHWDKPQGHMHNCAGQCPEGTGYNVNKRYIERIEPGGKSTLKDVLKSCMPQRVPEVPQTEVTIKPHSTRRARALKVIDSNF